MLKNHLKDGIEFMVPHYFLNDLVSYYDKIVQYGVSFLWEGLKGFLKITKTVPVGAPNGQPKSEPLEIPFFLSGGNMIVKECLKIF